MSSWANKESPMPGKYPTNEVDIQKPEPAVIANRNGGRRGTDKSDIEDDSGDILAAAPDEEVDLENGDGTELKLKAPNIVPRGKRRGLFAQLVIGIPEVDEPVQYSPRTKHFIVCIIAIAAVAAPMGYCILMFS